jgi:hypothetical protein
MAQSKWTVRHEIDENGETVAIIDGPPPDDDWIRKVRLARRLAEEQGERVPSGGPTQKQIQRAEEAWEAGRR